jgi:hypothetical protein
MSKINNLKLLFKDINLESDFCPDGSFYKSFFEKTFETVLLGNWRFGNQLKDAFLSQDILPFLWNSDESNRPMLLEEICSSNNKDSLPMRRGLAIIISAELERIFNSGSEDEYFPGFKESCVEYRIRLAPLIPGEFDYLHEIKKLGVLGEDALISKRWLSAGKVRSKNRELYEYWWSSIKRRPGASSERLEVIHKMNTNGVYSDSILGEVSKRGTKKVKRSLVSNISREMSDIGWKIKRVKKEVEKDPSNELLVEKLAKSKEIFDKMEAAIMLFADCDDKEIVSEMIDAVSKENLTWLIPAASKYYYLSRRIESKLAQESN